MKRGWRPRVLTSSETYNSVKRDLLPDEEGMEAKGANIICCFSSHLCVKGQCIRGIIGDAGGLGTDSLAIFSLWRCLRGGVVIKLPHNKGR
jgi:hypothetical protein